MRPVTVNPNPPYKIPVNMTTTKKAIIDGLKANGLKPVSGSGTFNTPAVLTILLALTAKNAGKPKWSGLPAKDKSLVNSLIKYFTENDTMKYGNARGPLIDNYGQYCSYCGLPVQDTALAIEHCLPKAVFPSQMLYYTNFFLCCPACNSFKGSKPTFQEAYEWAEQFNKPPNMQQVLDGGMGRQVWPNSTYSWSGFPPFLWDFEKDNEVPIADALNLDNLFVEVVNNEVKATIVGYNKNQPVLVGAWMNMNDFGNKVLNKQEDNFIKIVKINDSTQGAYSDRRVTNRTIAWLNILASLKSLNLFKAGSPEWKVMMYQVFITAKNSGFFEIWSWLFYKISGPTKANSVYLYFRVTATDPKQPLYYFPGTNVNELPTK
jgi:hypothetical protein